MAPARVFQRASVPASTALARSGVPLLLELGIVVLPRLDGYDQVLGDEMTCHETSVPGTF